MLRISYQYFGSPCGSLLLGECYERLCLCSWVRELDTPSLNFSKLCRIQQQKTVFSQEQTPLLEEVAHQLTLYFSGVLRDFSIPMYLVGTHFQVRVWEALRTIPYGETFSYAELALRVGSPRAFRAVGQANHRNPISIILPCHRVIGTRGALTGYGGGLAVKEYLLALEKQVITKVGAQHLCD